MKTETEPNNGILPGGNGAWDITQYPFGGDFMRPSHDLAVRITGEYPGKPGYLIAECERPNRSGTRKIVSDRIRRA